MDSNLGRYGIYHLICIHGKSADNNQACLNWQILFYSAKQLQKIFNVEDIQSISLALQPGGIRASEFSKEF